VPLPKRRKATGAWPQPSTLRVCEVAHGWSDGQRPSAAGAHQGTLAALPSAASPLNST